MTVRKRVMMLRITVSLCNTVIETAEPTKSKYTMWGWYTPCKGLQVDATGPSRFPYSALDIQYK